jgi:hypothetical protein
MVNCMPEDNENERIKMKEARKIMATICFWLKLLLIRLFIILI